MPANISVPQKLLHESCGHRLTLELTDGSLVRGLLTDAEDSMNVQLSNVTYTNREGAVNRLEFIYIRGSKIRLVVFPDMLRNAPIFARFKQIKMALPQQTPQNTQCQTHTSINQSITHMIYQSTNQSINSTDLSID